MKILLTSEICNEIIEKYKNGKSTYNLEKEYSISHEQIRLMLKSNGISRRTTRETNIQRFKNDIVVSNLLYNKLIGWMLGDGSLHYCGNQACFVLSSKHEEYIDYIINLFENENIKCRKYDNIDKKTNLKYYRLFTKSTTQFGNLYRKWYHNKTKIVPHCLNLTAESLKIWIYDDGTADKNKGFLRFCTCAFTVDECEFLCEKLNNYMSNNNFSHVIEKNKYPRIYVCAQNAYSLLNKIGFCELQCFEYKWDNILKHKQRKEQSCFV